ncbi:MAG TPA: VOC family protein [Phycisphaerales bacterium]|nr:VOC family protein [Phycisphaerales bacterium]
MIKMLKFAGVPVRDQDAALAFWTEKMGFRVVTDQPMGPGQRWIEIKPLTGETGLALFTPEGHEGRIGQFQSLSFRCEDAEKEYAELKAKGVEFDGPPKKASWGTFVIFRDPDGNKFVLGS